MRILKLNLQESISYLCTPLHHLSIDDIPAMIRFFSSFCKKQGISFHTDELILVCDASDRFSFFQPKLFGTAPVDAFYQDNPPPQCTIAFLSSGTYALYQIPGPSPEGIVHAVHTAVRGLNLKNWKPSADIVFVRGIQKDSDYSMQILIPIED